MPLDQETREANEGTCTGPVWDAQSLRSRPGWKISLPLQAGRDFLAYLRSHPDRGLDVDPLKLNRTTAPSLLHFAAEMRDRLLFGEGVVWLKDLQGCGISRQDQPAFCVALGALMGRVMSEYGPLYPVRDRGADYTREAVPVSMTNAETGIHTDSSSVDCLPDIVGLLCEQPSRNGGDSLLCNALRAYWSLRLRSPWAIKILEQDFIRDVVTPGRDQNQSNLLRNSFPIFSPSSPGQTRTFRYMRYWIEKGQERAGRPLSTRQMSALDALDKELRAPANIVRLKLERGDLLWVNNRRVAHGRERYRDTADNQRRLHRIWVEVPGDPRPGLEPSLLL